MNRKTIVVLCVVCLIILPSSSVLTRSSQAQAPVGILPVVAIHVSEYTQAHWAYSTWTYFSINRMLEEAFKSDGTPYVEVSDQDIENGGLFASGSPKYPILFSLACECISDAEAAQISSYANAGGFVYVGASSWTRYADGSYRSDFALSSQMGVRSVSSPSSNWEQVQTAVRTASNRLVNSVPANVAIDWRLPLTDHTLPTIERNQNAPHFAWDTRTKANNPAQVLMTINGDIMLSIKNASKGLYIYHSELAPLASFDIYSPVAYEYTFFKEAVQWAFENSQVPLVRLSPWPYMYNSAFIVRHDMDISYERVLWIAQSAQAENNLGVVGQYYIVTGDVRDASNSAQLVSLLQQAQSLGAQIGSHNGGLNCTPWNPSLSYGAYEYYHWGPDYAMSVYPAGLSGGMAYANNSIKLSFDDLQGWLGQRPNIWVSPAAQSCWDESLQIMQSLGIECSGEAATAPYPQFAFSMTTQGRTYDTLMLPFSRWITSSGLVCQSMDELADDAPGDITKIVDFYYNQGALVSPYSHSSSSSGIFNTYITYALSKPYMWSTTPNELRDWALMRQQVQRSVAFTSAADGQNSLTVSLAGSSSASTGLDVKLPFDVNAVSNLQVLVNGNPTSNYRLVGSNILKIEAGTASTVTVNYSTEPTQQQQNWIQTSQTDFQAGTLTNVDASSVPGQLSLALQTSGGQASTLFYDDFSNSSFTTGHWTARAGTWSVNNGYYHMVGEANVLCAVYSTTSSWTDYTAEARVRYVSGEYSGALDARLNPSAGSRYSLILYPNAGGPNQAVLVKFSSWQDLAGTVLGQTTVTTDTNWHNLKLDLKGNNIKGYYDGQLLFNVVDSSYASGVVGLDSYGSSVADYDWVNVTSAVPGAYYSSGSIVSSAFDCGQTASWGTISWTGSTPSGTSLEVRTRTASTQAGLFSASWSGVYSASGSAITSSSNRWIQYQAQLATTNSQTTPVLFDVTITYSTGSSPPPSSSWIQTSQSDFQAGTLTQLDATTAPGQLTLTKQSSQTAVLFFDDFSNSSWTGSHWTIRSGSWTVSSGYYNMAGSSGQLLETSCGDQSWTNYAVESRVRYISGEYTGAISARLNPSAGSRYSLLLYPNDGGPNQAALVKFSSWQDLAGTTLGQTTVTTDTNWHILRMELNDGNIKCYYDGTQIFNVNDNSYSSGRVSLESYGVSNAAYDWVNVTSTGSASYVSSGTLVSSAFDSGNSTSAWQTISWSASTPSGTNVQFRTRTASTQAGLASASWSGYYTASGAAITSPANRWIQYEATLSTSNAQATPTLSDVTVTYSSGS